MRWIKRRDGAAGLDSRNDTFKQQGIKSAPRHDEAAGTAVDIQPENLSAALTSARLF
jgi:hypothetical protein